MTTVHDLDFEEALRCHPSDGAYSRALSKCQELCHVLGGINDGQIDAILGELTHINRKTRSFYYWQLRLHFPNPFE